MQQTPQVLEQINKTLTALSDQIGGLSNQVKKLESHLYNDSSTGNLGVVQRQNDMEKRLTFLEEKDRKQRWFWTKISVGMPILITILMKVLEYFYSTRK